MIRTRTLLAALALALTSTATATAQPGSTVDIADYNLGDAAFTVPNSPLPVELQGEVYYPHDLGDVRRPLIMLVHGLFKTCADASGTASFDWPCPPGTRQLHSERGYRDLGRELAGHGYIVVSISSNGINGQHSNDQVADRAALMNKHLELWQRLSASGTGALAGKLPADFTHRVDMTKVGTMGHSRGGAAVIQQASHQQRKAWPEGVTIRAVAALAPATAYTPDGSTGNWITDIPYTVIMGTCDWDTRTAGSELLHTTVRHTAPAGGYLIHGANHNFYNTTWSNGPGSFDDAKNYEPKDKPAPPAGQCYSNDGKYTEQKQLTQDQQREVGDAYLSTFFRRYLGGEHLEDPVQHVTPVERLRLETTRR
ncbi:hypothetical protein AB0I53_49345 [Saccharopolyspora sp. NPDC050389]|uniref:hypothetical protein n=1 Tax=Saccharopolyspora sp. NPDC050389 TaxID=3155516 RepID=UPI00340CCE80